MKWDVIAARLEAPQITLMMSGASSEITPKSLVSPCEFLKAREVAVNLEPLPVPLGVFLEFLLALHLADSADDFGDDLIARAGEGEAVPRHSIDPLDDKAMFFEIGEVGGRQGGLREAGRVTVIRSVVRRLRAVGTNRCSRARCARSCDGLECG
jgi:hypothetical protein